MPVRPLDVSKLRRPITGRALVLGGIVVLAIVLLAAPLHRYLTARTNLQQAAAQSRAGQQQLTQLQQQTQQYNDPAYIEQQARVRLHYAMPGETVYTVLGDGQQGSVNNAAPVTTVPARAPGDTWNKRLWGSVVAAANAPAK